LKSVVEKGGRGRERGEKKKRKGEERLSVKRVV